MQKQSKRIAIIGMPGSGKSSLALFLGKFLNLPVYHLDVIVFKASGNKRNDVERIQLEKELVKTESWIIEGCSIRTLDLRFFHADEVIYLNFSRWLCLWRILKRSVGFASHLSNTGCLKIVNKALLEYTWKFQYEKSRQIKKIKMNYPNLSFHIFNTPKELANYIKQIKTDKSS